MMTKHYCKSCFRSIVDDKAPDEHMLMSPDNLKCEACGKPGSVVAEYFKWGEHKVTADRKHIKGAARHVGVNPNYSCWGDTYPYAE